MDAFAKAQFTAIAPRYRKVINSNDAFGYFVSQYGIQFFAPKGMSTDAEPSTQGLAELIRQIRRKKIQTRS